ncbi:unnamed protein product, partial [Ectocarpus sp. 12 AP-2014]
MESRRRQPFPQSKTEEVATVTTRRPEQQLEHTPFMRPSPRSADDGPDAVHNPPRSFSEAIDRVGLGPFQTKLVTMCGLGWVVDSMEILVL